MGRRRRHLRRRCCLLRQEHLPRDVRRQPGRDAPRLLDPERDIHARVRPRQRPHLVGARRVHVHNRKGAEHPAPRGARDDPLPLVLPVRRPLSLTALPYRRTNPDPLLSTPPDGTARAPMPTLWPRTTINTSQRSGSSTRTTYTQRQTNPSTPMPSDPTTRPSLPNSSPPSSNGSPLHHPIRSSIHLTTPPTTVSFLIQFLQV